MTRADIAQEAARAAPPISVATASLVGMTLHDWVLVATLVYVVLQAGFLMYRWWRLHTGRGNEE